MERPDIACDSLAGKRPLQESEGIFKRMTPQEREGDNSSPHVDASKKRSTLENTPVQRKKRPDRTVNVSHLSNAERKNPKNSTFLCFFRLLFHYLQLFWMKVEETRRRNQKKPQLLAPPLLQSLSKDGSLSNFIYLRTI